MALAAASLKISQVDGQFLNDLPAAVCLSFEVTVPLITWDGGHFLAYWVHLLILNGLDGGSVNEGFHEEICHFPIVLVTNVLIFF